MSISYKLDGRTVSREQFTRGIEGKVREMALRAVTDKVSGVRCPTHGKSPRVTEVRETSGGYEFSIEGCCDEAVARAQEFS